MLASRAVLLLFCLTLFIASMVSHSFAAAVSGEESSLPTPATAQPLTVLAWSPAKVGTPDKPALGKQNSVVEFQSGEQELHIPGVVPMFWLKANATPEQAKAALDRQPEGYRSIIWVWDGVGGDPLKNEADKIKAADGSLVRSIWADHGIAQTSAAMRDFFAKYKKIGGKLDYLVMDYEYGFTRWHPGMTPEAFAAIEADPRFKAEGWPQKLGFSDLVTELTKKPYPSPNQENWNAITNALLAGILEKSIYEPVREVFPAVKMSNYGNAYRAAVPDGNGYRRVDQIGGRELHRHVGTHQSGDTYGGIKTGLADKKLDGVHPFGEGPFKSLILGVNSARAMALHKSIGTMPWISNRAYANYGCYYGNTDYYQELVLHVAMTNPDVVLYWNPYPQKAGTGASTRSDSEQDQLLGRLIGQFNALAGFADRKTLVTELAGWYDPFILSGMTANGVSVWRFTPELDLSADEKVEPVLVSADPLRFRVKNRTVTFPGGRLHKPDGDAAPLGFWIIAPAAKKPIVD